MRVAETAETETVASHLHPVASYDLADHPRPDRSGGGLAVHPAQAAARPARRRRRSAPAATWTGRSTRPTPVTDQLDHHRARRSPWAGPAPVDRIAALAVANADGAVRIDIPAEAELDRPVLVTLTGTGHRPAGLRPHRDHGRRVRQRDRGAGAPRLGDLRQLGHPAGRRRRRRSSWSACSSGPTTPCTPARWRSGSAGTPRSARCRPRLGGDLVRLVETTEYAGPGGEIEQFGLYFADAGQHLEHRLFVDHNAPHTKSNVDYRGALQGQGAHSVWVGDVLIRKVAEGITTYESNRNLVLTDGCRADSVPNLEIETGEIAGAGHASTTGRFDDEQLFYLRSRGITEAEARRLVVHGFFADIIRRVGVPEIEQRLLAAVEAELAVTVGLPERATLDAARDDTGSAPMSFVPACSVDDVEPESAYRGRGRRRRGRHRAQQRPRSTPSPTSARTPRSRCPRATSATARSSATCTGRASTWPPASRSACRPPSRSRSIPARFPATTYWSTSPAPHRPPTA